MYPYQATVKYEVKLSRSKINTLNFIDTTVVYFVEFLILLQRLW
jgi:hypothetical protein